MSLPVSNRPEFRIVRSIFSLALALSPAMLFGQGGDPAPNYVVNTTADDATGIASNCTTSPEGTCTLRDALAAAGAVSASTITFDPTVFLATNSAAANTIVLSNGPLNFPSGTTITGLTSGSGALLTNLVTVSGNNATGVFSIASGVTSAVIANLSIKDGTYGISLGGELTVTGSTLSGNSAAISNILYLPPLSSPVELTLIDSTFSGNTGGAIYLLGGELTVTGSTFSGNSGGGAGAMEIIGASLTLKSSTISDNVGGGISGYYANLNIANSIVDVFSSGTGSTLSDLGGNLLNPSVPPNLSPLANNGGPTQTMLPQPGSAAICGGIAANIPAGVTTDQRGYPIENTTYPGYSSSTPCVDSGAVQTNYALAFTTQPPATATVTEAIAPAPVVTLMESGNLAGAVNTGTVRMTDSVNALSGATSEGLLSGTAAFPGLELPSGVNDDIFTAWLGLNPMLNISAQATVGVTAVSPTGPVPATMLSPATGTATILGTSNTLFEWSTGYGVTSYEFLIGTNGVGTSNILNTGPIATTSYTALTLPADGVTLFVRLGSLINGAWQNEDYVYTESGTAIPATLSPSSGAVSVSQTFTWDNGNDATNYRLVVTINLPGSPVLLDTGVTTETSATVTIPADEGATVIATLYQLVDGAWQHKNYTFTIPTTYVVNTVTDDATGTALGCAGSPEGICTLRDALAAANAVGASIITFDPTVFLATNTAAANTIALTNGTLNIPPYTTITGLIGGSGATLTNLVTVSGNNAARIFKVASGVTGVGIANLNIANGNNANGNGGGIYDAGELTVTDSTFSGNQAGGSGGAIYSRGGVLTVTGSTFSGNSASWIGGAIYSNAGTLTVTGSTFSGNSANNGGAIAIENMTGTLKNSTVSANGAGYAGGGIYIGSGFTLNIANSIVEGNYGGIYYDVVGPVNDLGGNVMNTARAVGRNYYSPYNYKNPGLLPLGYYGGLFQTMLPEPGSPAICGGIAANIPAGFTTDQRGYPIENTTYPGYSSSTPCVDSGAVQTNYAMTFTTQPPANATYETVIAPAPVTTVTESSNPAGALSTGTVTMTDSAGLLSGTTSVSLSSGTATFTNLVPSSTSADDIFTAWLVLNPSLSVPAQATVGVNISAPAPVPAAMVSPTPGTFLGTSNILFQWSRGAYVTSYELLIGTSGVGSSDILATAPLTTPSYTVPALPANSVPLYVRLGSLINGVWQTADYVYAESGPATLSPSSGSLSTSQLFTWSNGNEATYYQLVVQSDGPGSPVLFYSGATQETSATVNIPANGATVIATLYQLVNDVWQHTMYTFTAPGTRIAATLTPGSGTLSTSQLFDWSNGNEARLFHFHLGTKGFGSTDLLATGVTTETSVTVSIPANGKKVFAVLYQLVDDVWQHTDYTFTEP